MKKTSSEPIRVIKTKTCPSISNKSTLGYQLGSSSNNKLYIKVVTNDGGGNFSKDWIAWEDIQKALKSCSKEEPLNSFILSRLYKQNNSNNWGFLWACLVDLNVVNPISNTRSYELHNLKSFQAEIKQLMASKTVSPAVQKKRALAKKVSKKTVTKKRPSTSKKKTTKK
tara:strand:- start:3005 stop:3511 length:507 start_codon:yes stop_codon:yes gene_type:complete